MRKIRKVQLEIRKQRVRSRKLEDRKCGKFRKFTDPTSDNLISDNLTSDLVAFFGGIRYNIENFIGR